MRHLVVSVALALVLGQAGRAAAQVLSPGDLHEAHADLDDDDSCDKCHSGGAKVVADKCLACHEVLQKKMTAGTGLHGKHYRGKPCEECHIEHSGRSSRLIRWPNKDMATLDHTLTGWALDGKHKTTTCLKCHTQKASGRPTFLAAKTACASCHKDAHDGRFGATCQGCHAAAAWKEVKLDGLDHDKTRFALKGKHAKVECKKCHFEPPRYRGLAFGTCLDCHKDPHEGQFKKPCTACHTESGWADVATAFRTEHPGLSLGGGHAKVKCEACHDKGNDQPPTQGKDCVGCHKPVHEAPFGKACASCHRNVRWLGLPREIGLKSHDKTPYPLTGEHVDTACKSCHPTAKSANQRYRKLSFDRCAACHADKHDGAMAPWSGGECATCHTTRGFRPSGFGPSEHGKTRFPLAGKHQAAPCAACHPGSAPRLAFKVAKQACADCHDNPHGGEFAAEMKAGGCGRCHSPADWAAPKIDHKTWPLTGAHARAPCARCHGEVGTTKASAAYRGIARDCEGCHADVHAGQFRLSAPVKPCQACHTTDAFKLPRFDHVAEAGYALDGKHAKVACKGCHPGAELASGVTAVRYRLGYRRCKDCHKSPHREVE